MEVIYPMLAEYLTSPVKYRSTESYSSFELLSTTTVQVVRGMARIMRYLKKCESANVVNFVKSGFNWLQTGKASDLTSPVRVWSMSISELTSMPILYIFNILGDLKSR